MKKEIIGLNMLQILNIEYFQTYEVLKNIMKKISLEPFNNIII